MTEKDGALDTDSILDDVVIAARQVQLLSFTLHQVLARLATSATGPTRDDLVMMSATAELACDKAASIVGMASY